MAKVLAVIPRALVYAILVIACAAVLVANLPGQMSYDSVQALYAVRHGLPPTFSSPLMLALLRVSDRISHGTALFVAVDVLLFFLSLGGLSLGRRAPSFWAVPVAVLIGLSPLTLLTQGVVWHDVLFADLAIAGFTSLVLAAWTWDAPRARLLWIVCSGVLLALAALSRQNGVLCLPIAAIALWFIARARGMRLPIGAAAAFFVGSLALVVVANEALSAASGNAAYRGGVKMVQMYDIVGMLSLHDPAGIRTLDGGDARLGRAIRRESKAFSPYRVDDIELHAPALWVFLQAQPAAAISRQWRTLVASDPGSYLRTRLAVFSQLLFTPSLARCEPVFAGIDGKPAWLRALGLREGRRPQDVALESYSERFFRTPIFSQVFYAALALGLVVFLILRGETADLAVAAMLVAALAVAASYFFIAISCSFRLFYFLDASAAAAALYVSARPRLRRKTRRSATGPRRAASVPASSEGAALSRD